MLVKKISILFPQQTSIILINTTQFFEEVYWSKKQDIDQAMRDIFSDNIELQHKGIMTFRQKFLFNIKQNQHILSLELVKRLSMFSQMLQYPQLAFQSVIILVQIKSPFGRKLSNCTICLITSLLCHYKRAVATKAIMCLKKLPSSYMHPKIAQLALKSLSQAFDCQHLSGGAIDIFMGICQNSSIKFNPQIISILIYKAKSIYQDKYTEGEAWIKSVYIRCNTEAYVNMLLDSGSIGYILKSLKLADKGVPITSLKIIVKMAQLKASFVSVLFRLRLVDYLEQLVNRYHENCAFAYLIADILNRIASHSNLLLNQHILESNVLMGYLIAIPQSYPLEKDVFRIVSQLITFGNHQKLFVFCSKTNHIMNAYVKYLGKYYRVKATVLSDLIVVLRLGDEFPQNGQNIFVRRLRNEGIIEKLKFDLNTKDQEVAMLIEIILDRYS